MKTLLRRSAALWVLALPVIPCSAQGDPPAPEAGKFLALARIEMGGAAGDAVPNVAMDARLEQLLAPDTLLRMVKRLDLATRWKVTEREAAMRLEGMVEASGDPVGRRIAIQVSGGDLAEAEEIAGALRADYLERNPEDDAARLRNLPDTLLGLKAQVGKSGTELDELEKAVKSGDAERAREAIRTLEARMEEQERVVAAARRDMAELMTKYGIISAPFQPTREPLDPEEHPLHGDTVNRDRIYDFYAKQAMHAMAQSPRPTLLGTYPGLDSGKYGHWGNQNEDTWRGDGWARMDMGSMQSGVFRSGDITVPRGVCVRLGEKGELAACFDPDTLTWRTAWRGGFVGVSSFRQGFIDGLHPAGDMVEIPAEAPAGGEFRYRGFYRQGLRVVFSYTRDGVDWLDTAWTEDGKFVKTKVRADAPEAAALTAAGPAQWPQVLETAGETGGGSLYAVDTVRPPASTPWGSVFHFGDHDFFPNGDAALCTIEGEVWVVSGLDAELKNTRWRRFAAGLHQPLGLKIVDGLVYVMGRNQITLLRDLNGDGEADEYSCFSNAFQTSPAGHDFVTGLQRDAEGRFYFASGNQGVCRISPDGKQVEVLATGFRNPDGLGLGPNGEILVGSQEGEWTPASQVAEVTASAPGGFYGYLGPGPGRGERVLPILQLPRGVDNSCGGQVFVEGDKWGLPAGMPVHLSFGVGGAFAVIRDAAIPGQAGAVPLPGDFSSGAHRGRFHPIDGQLWVTGSAGWGTYTPEPGCFQRLRYTGAAVNTPVAYEARGNGIMLTFLRPVEAAKLKAEDWLAQAWSYRYGAHYGSDEYSVLQPDKAGHDVLEITSIREVDGGKRVFLEIPNMLPADTVHLFNNTLGLLARDTFLTIHKLGPDYTDFPGYVALAKRMPVLTATDGVPEERPLDVQWEHGLPGRALRVRATTGLQYEEKELRAKAGERLSLSFENPDVVPHNWVLGTPGSAQAIFERANRMIAEPGALRRHYVPDMPEVLAHTRLVEPANSTTIHIDAPAEPGEYPYLCTFPGHGMIMRGVLKVE